MKFLVNLVKPLTTQLRIRLSTMKIVVMFSLAMSSQQELLMTRMKKLIKYL